MDDRNPIQVAGRLFGALEYMAENGACGLTQIADHLGLNKSTAHRVVSSLIYMGYVRQNQDTGKYEPTFKLVDLGNRIMARIDVIGYVRPHLRRLMEASGETVHFVHMEGTDCTYIDKMESEQNNVRMVSHIGSSIPFYRSSVGKAMAALMTREEVRLLWNGCRIERMTPYTITNFDDFMDTLDDVRRKGYALDNEENEIGVRCIGTALNLGESGRSYAISISVPIARMDNDRIRELSEMILHAKEAIEKDFLA